MVLFVLFSQLACIVYRCPEQFFLPSGVRTGWPIKKRNNILRKRRLVSPFFSSSSFLSVPFMFHLSFDIFTRRVFVKTVQFLKMLKLLSPFPFIAPWFVKYFKSNQTSLQQLNSVIYYMLLRENFLDWSSLRCNLVHSGRLNLANAWFSYLTCNAEIFNKPQVWLWSKK